MVYWFQRSRRVRLSEDVTRIVMAGVGLEGAECRSSDIDAIALRKRMSARPYKVLRARCELGATCDVTVHFYQFYAWRVTVFIFERIRDIFFFRSHSE